jgi:hypothetical protein
MKNRVPIITTSLIGASLLAVATFVSVGQNNLAAQPAADPTHAAHVAAGAMPPDTAMSDAMLTQQLLQMQAKVAQLESALAKISPPIAATPAGAAMPGMPDATMSATPPMSMGMGEMKSGGNMPGMSASATPAPTPAMAGMSAAAAPAGGMMSMMDKMMGMMDKMMSMGGDSAPMPSGGGSMPPAPAAGMSGGGGMDMDKMEMAGMMGMGAMGGGAAGAMPQSALPGFPGASHLYHIGATDFFLDHPQHISLTTEQQTWLNKAKEQALLAKSTADRAIQQAEQELWMLTAADQPDNTQIVAKVTEIEKLKGDARLRFIGAIGSAAKILNDEQRKALTGFAPPVSAAPAAAPMTGGMKDM